MAQRIHITGGPGSGKTTIARKLGAALGLPVYEVDAMWLDLQAEHQPNPDIPACRLLIASRMRAMADQEAWIADGASVADAGPLLERAQIIIYMQAPWRVAGYRIVSRHVKAELRRKNRWPGWWKLAKFWNWSRRWYAGRNEPGLNDYGTPRTLQTLIEHLAPYEAKVVGCRTYAQVHSLVRPERTSVAV